MTKDKLIEKQRELINLIGHLCNGLKDKDYEQFQKLESEILQLESKLAICESLVGEKIEDVQTVSSTEYPPLESKPQMTAELAALLQNELDLRQYMTNLLYAAHDWGGHGFDKWVEEMIDGIYEFASQFQKLLPSDEDIEKWAEKGIYGDTTHKNAWLQGRTEGAKAVRDGEIPIKTK